MKASASLTVAGDTESPLTALSSSEIFVGLFGKLRMYNHYTNVPRCYVIPTLPNLHLISITIVLPQHNVSVALRGYELK